MFFCILKNLPWGYREGFSMQTSIVNVYMSGIFLYSYGMTLYGVPTRSDANSTGESS